ncbi:unnamed protein product, partial [Polarella glacialis]
EFESSHGCPAEAFKPQIEEQLRTWLTGASLGQGISREFLDQIFDTQPCLIRIIIKDRQLFMRVNDHVPCVNDSFNSLYTAANTTQHFLNLFLISGAPVPDVEFLTSIRDRPVLLLHETAPIFSPVTTETHADILWPDPRDFLTATKYSCGGDAARHPVSWADRKPKLLFRGTFSGATHDAPMRKHGWHLMPRARLMLFSRRFPDLIDAGLINGNPESGIPEELWVDPDFASFGKLFKRDFMPRPEQFHYRYLAAIDGVSSTSRLPCDFMSGSTVFKQKSPYFSWYERWLEPWKHYVPLTYDLGDLPSALNIAQDKPELMEQIASEGRRQAYSLLNPRSIVCYLTRLFSTYSSTLDFEPQTAGPDWHSIDLEDSEPFEASFDHFPLPPFGAEVQTSPRSPAALSQFPGSCGLASQQPAVVFLPNIASPARQRLTAEVSVQTGRQLPDEVTPQRAPGVSIAVQAGRTPLLSDSSMQATECRDTVDSATQVKPALQDASSQARGECTEFASQTEAAPTVETSSQAGSEFLPSSVETQTAEAQCVHAGVQAEWEAPAVEAVKAVAATAEFGMQTTPAMLKSATSQTQAAERTNMATQVILPQMVHMSVQAKDEVAASQAAAREGQLKELQSRLQASQAAEVETTRLIAESTQLSEELGRCKDQSQ